jgi:DNA-binding NarL/FixJ family response regulator
MRCLIVEDQDSPRALIERLLRRHGHRSTAVRGGSQALAAVQSAEFDVAIVDLEMPGMSGSETITTLRRLAPHMRVLVVSGWDDRAHVLAAVAAGADGYLLKDELGEELGPSLQKVVAGQSPFSAKVASIMLRQLRPPGVPMMPPPPARGTLELRLGTGTHEVPAITEPPPPEEPPKDDT